MGSAGEQWEGQTMNAVAIVGGTGPAHMCACVGRAGMRQWKAPLLGRPGKGLSQKCWAGRLRRMKRLTPHAIYSLSSSSPDHHLPVQQHVQLTILE
jgi:hypothetical protein